MIERLNTRDKKKHGEIAEFLNSNFNYDFYFTENNSRIYVTDIPSLRRLFKDCTDCYVVKERGEYTGVLVVWKSDGGGKTRRYVKVTSKTPEIAKNLVTILLWNNSNELFFKIKKDSPYVAPIKQKGFRFHGGRGTQILLRGKSKITDKIISKKDRYEED